MRERDHGKTTAAARPRIGVSACLLGAQVRFDGGHKQDRFVLDIVGGVADLVSLCPEVEIGLGVPRPNLRLVRRGEDVRLVSPKTGEDITERMRAYAHAKVEALEAKDLDGFILKRASPSCGLERVKVYDENDVPARTGRGVFAEVLNERMPMLPLEEEGRLNDAVLRDAFFTRVWAYRRIKQAWRGGDGTGALVELQSQEKLLLMAHDPERQKQLGRTVARASEVGFDEAMKWYTAGFMGALQRPASRRRHVNAMQHIAGYVKNSIGPEERAELAQAIEDYRLDRISRVVPLTLLRHHIRHEGVDYIFNQSYLQPYPRVLEMRAPL